MEIDDKIDVKHKIAFLKLALKISRLWYHDKEPDTDLLLQAREIGDLAGIPDDELNNLLFNLNIK